MWAQLSEELLAKANAQFWEQMLNMHLEEVPDAERFCVGPGHLRASIDLSGQWAGRIEIRLAPGLAQSATAAMLMQSAEAVTIDDTLDAIREIVNIIGGVIKSALPRPCAMALPESSLEGEHLCTEPPTGTTLTAAFRHETGGLVVKVQEESCLE